MRKYWKPVSWFASKVVTVFCPDRWGLAFVCLALSCCAQGARTRGVSRPRTIHVFVALADNEYQGIVPVPSRLGNGDDPGHNLYWGAAYGIKTFFARSAEWRILSDPPRPKSGASG